MEVKKVAEEWKIWNEEEEAAGKKQSERMPMRKVWDHMIDVKEGFVLRKGKVYPLSRKER